MQELMIDLSAREVEAASDALFDLGALSVSIEDQHLDTELEEPIYNEPGEEVNLIWQDSRLIALFASDSNLQAIVAQLEQILGIKLKYSQKEVLEQDWVKLTQSQFGPIKVSEKFYILPSWHDAPEPDAIIVTLDPGLAFGTGSHPTTFMCLKYLANKVDSNLSVLDYGCGSGILAISAKKLGAKEVLGVDIDKQAIEASLSNALVNQVLVDFALVGQIKLNTYNLVVANILANPLRLLAPNLALLVKKAAKLILAGILDSQTEELLNIYSQYFKIKPIDSMDGWVLLEGTKD